MVQEQFEQVEPAVPESVGILRRAISDYSREIGAGDDVVTSLQLAVSEAISNAVVHAFVEAEAPGSVRVLAHPDGSDALCVIVSDDGCGMRARTDSPGLGIGLPLMTQMTQSLEFRENSDGGTDVAMRFALAA